MAKKKDEEVAAVEPEDVDAGDASAADPTVPVEKALGEELNSLVQELRRGTLSHGEQARINQILLLLFPGEKVEPRVIKLAGEK